MSEATWEKRKAVWFAEIKKYEAENEKLRAEIKTLKPPKWLNEEAERRIADYDRMREENAALKAEVQRLRGALQWYACEHVIAYYLKREEDHVGSYKADNGERARAALQATESETKGTKG